MSNINRTMVLNSLVMHETLTTVDIGKEENLGVMPGKVRLNFLLDKLN